MRNWYVAALAVALATGCNFDDNNIALGNNTTGTVSDTGSGSDSGGAADTGAGDAGSTTSADLGGDAAMTADVGADLGGDAGAGDAGADAGADMGVDMAPPMSPCPDTTPGIDDTCSIAGLVCEYGDDPRDSCRTRATCDGNQWEILIPRCTALPSVRCPSTIQDADGNACGTADSYCEYNGLVCHCTGSLALEWQCDTPNIEPGCPTAQPRLGQVCAEDAKVCAYECGPEGNRICANNAWQPQDGQPCRF